MSAQKRKRTASSKTQSHSEKNLDEIIKEVGDSLDSPIDGTEMDGQSNLRALVEKNIKWSQVIYHQNKQIKGRLTLMVIGSYIRLALILAPVILGIIYLPPLLKDVWLQYHSLFGQMSGSGTNQDVLGGLLQLLENK